MDRYKILLLAVISFLSVGLNAQTDTTQLQGTLTLKQCVDIAIKNNLLVEQSDIAKQQNAVNYNQAIGNMLPYIGASGSQGASFGRSLNPYTYQYINQQINTGSYGISGSLLLFNGLLYQNALKQNKLAYDASKLDLQQQKENISLTVLLAYLQILSSQELLSISRSQADVDKRQLDRLEQMNNEGALPLLSNLTDFRGAYATDLANIASTVNNLELAKVNLFNILNIPYKRDVQFEPITVDLQAINNQTSSDSIYMTALKTLPGIKSADLKIRAAQKGLMAARGQYYPSLSLNAGVNTSYSNAATQTIFGSTSTVQTSDFVTIGGTNYNVYTQQQNSTSEPISFGDQFKNNRYTSVNLTLSVPILNYLRARNNVKFAKISLENAQYNATSTKLVLQQNVEQAYQNMLLANAQYKSYTDAVAAFAESFRTTEVRFNEGVIAADVYVIAKGHIDQANINLIIAKYNYIFRSKILNYYQGNLKW